VNVGVDIQTFLKNNTATMHIQPLRPFEGLEARLAYSQYLLTLTPPLTGNSEFEHRTRVQAFFNRLNSIIKGIPSLFALRTIAEFIDFGKEPEMKLLVRADDATILNNAGGI
jgi:hypothetical protein